MLNYIASHGRDRLKRSNFFATNATPGTGIASKDAPTSFSATAGLINIYNQASLSAGDNQVIIPVMIRLRATTANTSATDFRLVGSLDAKDRYSSGGTELTNSEAYVSTASGFTARTAKGKIYAGELTLAAAGSSAVRVFNTQVSEAVFAADEVVELWFGEAPSGSATTNIRVVPYVQIPQGCSLAIHEVATAQAADPAFEFEIWTIEHGHPRDN